MKIIAPTKGSKHYQNFDTKGEMLMKTLKKVGNGRYHR